MAEIARALATVEQISSIHPIPDADAIVRARIRGWDVVTRVGEFTEGDTCLYIEVDSHLDTSDPRFEFLAPRGVRTSEDGFVGHVLKTAKLRGQYSQGIAFPIHLFPELTGAAVGDNVTALLPVQKWDPPLPAELAGVARGPLPYWIPKTDEERVENVAGILNAGQGLEWVATEKVDGTSMTVWVAGDERGVAQRNYDLAPAGNSFWSLTADLHLHEQLAESYPGSSVALQGELFGPGIQSNPLRVKAPAFRAFTLYANARELTRSEWPPFVLDIAVPAHPLTFPATLDECLEQVDGLRSLITPGRAAEGVVWRGVDRATVEVNGRIIRASFKSLSRAYLMKHDR